jgi:hypothetical protein
MPANLSALSGRFKRQRFIGVSDLRDRTNVLWALAKSGHYPSGNFFVNDNHS